MVSTRAAWKVDLTDDSREPSSAGSSVNEMDVKKVASSAGSSAAHLAEPKAN